LTNVLSPGLLVHSQSREQNENKIESKIFLLHYDDKQEIGSFIGSGRVSLSNNHEFIAYVHNDDIWVLDFSHGEHSNITNSSDCSEHFPVWSPDDEAIAYFGCGREELQDVYIYYLDGGINKNVSNTPDRIEESFIAWWSGQPESIFFGSSIPQKHIPGEVIPPQCHSGSNRCSVFVTMVGVNGEDYRILDQLSGIFFEPSLSPDGKTIAYDGGNLYDFDTGEHAVLIPSDFGITTDIPVHSDGPELVDPAWSPDGQKIAWTGHGNEWGDIGIILFDLEEKTGRVLYTFDPYYVNLSSPPWFRWMKTNITWSPDGEWLSFISSEWRGAESETINSQILWVFSVDGETKRSFDTEFFSYEPVWSPDSEWVVHVKYVDGYQETVEVIRVKDGYSWELGTFESVRVLYWLE